MARITKAQKIAEWDRRHAEEFQMAQHEAAKTLREILVDLDPKKADLLRKYLKQAEAEHRIVRNARFGGLCVEAADTPWHCSVASDAYWQN
jgi:hypothetical protein